MSKMTGTTAVTAGLGTLVLLNAVLSWGTQRTPPQVRQDITRPSAATLDPAVALQLRSGAWRHWPAPTDDPAAVVSGSSSPRQPASPTLAAQPNVPVASLAEPPTTLDRANPVEQLARSTPSPPPLQSATAASPSSATPPDPLPAVSRPPPDKERMLLAGPTAEPAASVQIEQEGSSPHLPAPPSEPPQAEPPGNVSALPASRFGPDSFKRFERNGF
jgi:hypothetical protein